MNAHAPVIALALALASVGQAARAQAPSDLAATPKVSPSGTNAAKPAKPAAQSPKRSDALDAKAVNDRGSAKQEAPGAVRTAPAGASESPCHHAKESDA